ncbi:piggyBac transposable element-derived protein 4-like [Salvelinus alpinus]|uniref:piggyBac transposable element-derived protein 4-like n=1 Tax=Salvelinus alpinus TaxID=8036 RepID=UPI0039FD9B00
MSLFIQSLTVSWKKRVRLILNQHQPVSNQLISSLKSSLFYNPGPNVTVDEQLMAFRGRCPFRQYIPSKPAKYGIKIWAACDAASSHVWNLQVYMVKPDGGVQKKNQRMWVVLDMTQGLRPELPPQLFNTWNRPINSSKFVFMADTSLVSYVPKKGKNVVLMSTLHRNGRICGQEHEKREIIMDYNATKEGLDNLDKLVTGYSCKIRTLRWQLVIFFNISAYNTFVTWMSLNPDWNRGKLQGRQIFLEELGKALVRPQIHEATYPKDPSFCSHREEDSGGGCWCPIRPTNRTNISNIGSN